MTDTNSMNTKRKVGYLVTLLANGALVYFATSKWGDEIVWFYLGAIILTTFMLSSNHKMTRLYWKKQVWRCDTCGRVIDDDSDLIVTFRSGGRTHRYDTSGCMSAGIKEGVK